MASIELSQKLQDHFSISSYEQAKSGSQKTVFIVKINNLKYALKIIKLADDRFEREVRICEQFCENNGIPSILKIEQFESDTIILEEYIAGNDLSELINDYINNEDKVCKLIHALGSILTPVWNARYIHRDLKPQNIRVKANGEPVVLDFGIARALDEESITAAGFQPGTWLFASPEQFGGLKRLISYRTDFFCLGIIAYHLYTGKLPFGDNKNQIDTTFQKELLPVNTGNNRIDKFCNAVFKINPSERPRIIKSFLKFVEI